MILALLKYLEILVPHTYLRHYILIHDSNSYIQYTALEKYYSYEGHTNTKIQKGVKMAPPYMKAIKIHNWLSLTTHILRIIEFTIHAYIYCIKILTHIRHFVRVFTLFLPISHYDILKRYLATYTYTILKYHISE